MLTLNKKLLLASLGAIIVHVPVIYYEYRAKKSKNSNNFIEARKYYTTLAHYESVLPYMMGFFHSSSEHIPYNEKTSYKALAASTYYSDFLYGFFKQSNRSANQNFLYHKQIYNSLQPSEKAKYRLHSKYFIIYEKLLNSYNSTDKSQPFMLYKYFDHSDKRNYGKIIRINNIRALIRNASKRSHAINLASKHKYKESLDYLKSCKEASKLIFFSEFQHSWQLDMLYTCYTLNNILKKNQPTNAKEEYKKYIQELLTFITKENEENLKYHKVYDLKSHHIYKKLMKTD